MSRILVWLSWGVDSAVASYLLKQQGHEVIVWFMKNYVQEDNLNCQTKQDRDMALQVAQHLWIDTFIIFDFRQQYQEQIIDYIHHSYLQGITPNPDVLCNSLIKFNLFVQKALELWCDKIATGHYARIQEDQKWFHLLTGKDKNKDQSYFLSQLTQHQLSKSSFPLWEMNKKEVRTIAKQIGLPNAERPDSQWLCFIGNIAIEKFLSKKIANKTWNVIDTQGNTVGTHKWAYYYTIGQRHGFQTNFKAYIVNIDIEQNIITVTKDKQDPMLYTTDFDVQNWHRINEKKIFPHQTKVKIRYRQTETIPAILSQKISNAKTSIHITLQTPSRSVSPGQFAVAYDEDEVIWSWVIAKTRQ